MAIHAIHIIIWIVIFLRFTFELGLHDSGKNMNHDFLA